VRPAAVFTAEPPSSATNLHTKRIVYHGPAMFVPPDKIPEGIFTEANEGNGEANEDGGLPRVQVSGWGRAIS